ncbi:MAG: response regulator transcription factor [Phycisphaerae bacterium]
MDNEPLVFVVDDDAAMRKSLRFLIESVGLAVRTFDSAHSFLDGCDEQQRGCLVLDVRMPGMSGLELQDVLAQRKIQFPIIIITGHGEVPMAVKAIQAGAMDFIEKPFSDQVLLDRIQKAIAQDRVNREERTRRDGAVRLAARLTPRERQVMALVVAGLPNKQIAAKLGLSQKTIEVHRAHVMSKMETESLPDLVREAQLAEVAATGKP